jgi:hypothetical protein
VNIGELQAKGVGLYLHQQGIDTTPPAGKALFEMLGVFAEFEWETIRERVMVGLAKAKAQGTKLGRRRVAPEVEKVIAASLQAGKGILSTAGELGVGVSTVQRVKAQLQAPTPIRSAAASAEDRPRAASAYACMRPVWAPPPPLVRLPAPPSADRAQGKIGSASVLRGFHVRATKHRHPC